MPFNPLDKLVFESAPLVIGKTEWRYIVYERVDFVSPHAGQRVATFRFTEYQWRSKPGALGGYFHWQSESQHPRYNAHDGENAGLPKTLRKIYEQNRPAVEAALKGFTYQEVFASLFGQPIQD